MAAESREQAGGGRSAPGGNAAGNTAGNTAGDAAGDAAGVAAGWGALLAALLASSCCVLPLVLFLLGVGGAWIGNLTALAPYKPIFLGSAAVLLAVGFWRVYRPRPAACGNGGACGTPVSQRLVGVLLWVSAALVALAALWDRILPLILSWGLAA